MEHPLGNRSKAKTVLEIGTARSQAGQLSYGSLDAVGLPTGGVDTFPIIIAQGRQPGPVLWLTASIHGDEYTGIITIHQVLNSDLVNQMRGTIIAVPTLNPAGLRMGDRRAYYLPYQDPNRLFPAMPIPSKRPPVAAPDDPLSPLELAYRRLFDLITDTGDYLIDLHNYSIGAIPFAFRDPIYYHDGERSAAQQLGKTMDEMLAAFGHTIINEFASADYLKRNLHRSVSGAVLNTARIPAFTVELGGYLTVDPAIVNAATAGIRNVMRWADMLDEPTEPITGIQILSPGYPIRRTQHPHAPHSGIVSFLVKPGDKVAKGDPIARLADIYGRPLGAHNGLVYTEHNGYVLGVSQGTAFYENDPLLSLAIRDEGELVLQIPT